MSVCILKADLDSGDAALGQALVARLCAKPFTSLFLSIRSQKGSSRQSGKRIVGSSAEMRF